MVVFMKLVKITVLE